jgi:glyoxylase-like metal-dependent hydrolase (beta-lactamase superfamily II)
LPTLEIKLPTVTFTDKMVIRGTLRTVELVTYGGGHSPSDAFMYLPETGIAFLADLLHVGYHAAFTHGNPEVWLEILDKIEALQVQTLVPGHGAIGGLEELRTLRRYLTDTLQAAQAIIANGGSADNLEIHIPEPYQQWGAPSIFEANLKFLLKRAAQ